MRKELTNTFLFPLVNKPCGPGVKYVRYSME